MEPQCSGIKDAEIEVLVGSFASRCPADVGYSECPMEAPNAINRGAYCCSGNGNNEIISGGNS